MPKRIQLKRTKGWRKPAGAIVVARGSRHWGNPYAVGDPGVPDRATAVSLYRRWLFGTPSGQEIKRRARDELAGKDLCCWCPPDEPCHADVLMEVANGE